MSDSPTISVIMPVRNGEKYIADALKTILDQAWPVQEILVVDDGSTDRSREIVETLASRFPAI
ncbi:glycosyltransferase, partial [Mesorhizobium sp.]